METPHEVWIPAEFDTSKPPKLDSALNISSSDAEIKSNFPRLAKWCPDGSVVLAQCENRTFQFFDMESQALHGEQAKHNLAPVREFVQAAPILDFLWYPTATLQDLASFCFVASIRECPVKLLDASTGRLRASYRIVDHRERQIAPHALAFNLTAQKLYCGFEDAIEVFDISRPGEGIRILTTPSKKSKDGLKGIVSSLAFCPSYSPEECFYAAGSFSPTNNNIAMFSDVGSEPVMFIGGGPQAGITQLQFNPVKPNILYATYRGRGSGSVYSWDIRSNVHVPLEIFRTSNNPTGDSNSRTNQKIRFDIEPTGRLLSIGDQTGTVSVFKLDDGVSSVEEEHQLESSFDDTKINDPYIRFKAHEGSVAFHPFKSRLLSASGSRHFTDEYLDSSESEDDGNPADHATYSKASDRRDRFAQPVAFDSTIKTWDF